MLPVAPVRNTVFFIYYIDSSVSVGMTGASSDPTFGVLRYIVFPKFEVE